MFAIWKNIYICKEKKTRRVYNEINNVSQGWDSEIMHAFIFLFIFFIFLNVLHNCLLFL